MKTIPLLTLLCAWLPVAAQAQDALEPCGTELLGEYYQGVEERIDSAIGRRPELSLTTLPSFSPESGVRLVGAEVYYVEFQSSFWADANTIDRSGIGHMDFDSPKVRTRVYHSRLDPDIAHDVMQAYGTAISAARESDRIGLDGVSYRFTLPGVGCGGAWSPDPETHNGTLVQLLELLTRHTRLSRPLERQRSEEAIARTLKLLQTH